MKKHIILAFLLQCLCLSSFANDINFFEKKIAKWDKTLVATEIKISKGISNFDEETLAKQKLEIKQIRDYALEEGIIAKELLESRNVLLSSLGEENEQNLETPQIKEKRRVLKNEIKTIDSRVKSSSLIQIKAQELLNHIERLEKENSKSKLLYRSNPIYKISSLSLAYADLKTWISSITLPKYYITSLVVFIFGIILFFSKRFVARINLYMANSIKLKGSSVSKTYFLLAAIGSFLMIVTKFNIFGNIAFINLQLTTLAILSIVTSFANYRILTSIHFKSPKQIEEESLETTGKDYTWLVNFIIRLVRYGSIVILVLASTGFSELSSYLSLNIFTSFVSIILAVSAINMFNRAGEKFSANNNKTIFSPLVISLIEPFIALVFLALALAFWGITPEQLYANLYEYNQGIPIGNITINPLNFLFAIGLLFLIICVTKIVQWFISDRVLLYANIDTGIKDTVNALLGYLGVIFAVIIALGTLGVSMSSFAIIAGALSVGIGFGLQAIVSNFISGLILLFERPIKVGDWIMVGDKEGIVKKIRVRSTEIETFHYASIMVPNSQFITESVTNLTLNNAIGRADILVGVKYGSDIDQVKEILLKIVSAHPEIRKKPEPRVFLQNFGDSSIDFEVRGYLKDVSNRKWVASEIRFQIYKKFAEHNIEIPFPQRDVYLKQV